MDILNNKKFWFSYYYGDQVKPGQGLDANDEADEEYTFLLHVDDEWSLKIDFEPIMWFINISLVSNEGEFCRTLGWWDEARWHPHVLRWEEIIRLKVLFDKCEDGDIHPDYAFLLLLPFVANTKSESDQYFDRKQQIFNVILRTGLFSESESNDITERGFIEPVDDDYIWSSDPDLGWIVDGDYPCYSLRNRAHIDGEEGTFPFKEWNQMLLKQ